MRYFKARLTGREVGSIGVEHHIDTIVNGNNEDKARLNLYNRFEHIKQLKFEDVTSFVIQSKFNNDICIRTYPEKNGFHLFNNKTFVIDSPVELISDLKTRIMVRIEAHKTVWQKADVYCVLSENYNDVNIFNVHSEAFKYCEKLESKIKGVYRVVRIEDKIILGALNIYGAKCF